MNVTRHFLKILKHFQSGAHINYVRLMSVSILLMFLLGAAYLSEIIRERQYAVANISHYNIVWAATRMSADLNRFGQALAQTAVPGAKVDKAEFKMRADIVKNRISVMSAGEFGDFTTRFPEKRAALAQVTADFDQLLENAEGAEANAVPDLLDDLAEIQERMAQVVSATRAFSGEQERRETLELANLHIFFSLIVFSLLLFGCGMLIFVSRQHSKIKQSNDDLKLTTDNLARTSVSRQYLDAAINNIPQALCMADASGRVIIWNESFIRMFGSSRQILETGAHFTKCSAAENGDDGIEKLAQNLFADLQPSIDMPNSTRFIYDADDGRSFEVSRQTMIGGWVATFEDITDRKRAEAERLAALTDAETARTRELAAEAANRAKSSFLAIMSHEIRTPMNAVLGLASTLLEEGLEEEHRTSVESIHRAGDDLMKILNDILDYSKLEAGQLTLEIAPFSPEALTDNVLSMVASRATAKGLVLRAAIEPDVPRTVAGDAGRIRQVLLNLISNAVKFTDNGEILVSARLIGLQDRLATIEWRVSDTGIGIAPDQVGALFNEFIQADTSITRRFGGTGLGLAICKRIITQMGGEISVSSSPGQGSTFRFTLDLPVADSVTLLEKNETDLHERLNARIRLLGRPLRVLITDDNTTNRLITNRMLKTFNIEIFMASNGLDAIAKIKQNSVDFVLMDMRMPEMDGLQATREIRAMGGKNATIPIIAFTANAFSDDIDACRKAGMNGFLSKPVRKKNLIEQILAVLADEGPRRTAPRRQMAG